MPGAVIARILREMQSDRDRGGESFSSKLRNSHRNVKIIYRAFHCEVELYYITVSRLLLVPLSKCLRQYQH